MTRSELSYTLADYRKAGVEAPRRCVASPELTEGQMMTEDEAQEFVKDSIATLRILADKKSDRFAVLVDNFRADMAYLAEVGTISQDDYNDLVHPDNLRF